MNDVSVALAQAAIEIGDVPDCAFGAQYRELAEGVPICADRRRDVDPLDGEAAR